MKKLRMVLILLSLLSVTICSFAGDGIIRMSKVQMYNLGIKLGKPEPVKQIPMLYAPAKVVVPPDQEYIVSASLAGLINKLNVAIGDTVQKGQVLAHINSPDLLALQRQFLKANSQRNLAWAAYQRDKKLLDEGVISDRRWQETRAQYVGYVSEANEARQLLEITGMTADDIKKLENKRRLTSQLDVYSPITGVVMDRMAVAGERIDILAPLYRIANLAQLWLEINIPQERLNSIAVGDRVLVSNAPATARISLLGQSVNPTNQTILARAVIDGKPEGIRAGQTVNTQIIQTSDKPVYKVPNAAVAQSEGLTYIFVRTPEGFLMKAVNILGKEGRYSIITADMQADEEIAIRGAVALKAKWMGLGSEEDD